LLTRRGVSTSQGCWLASRPPEGRHPRGRRMPAPRDVGFDLRSAYRADPGAPVATEGGWRGHALEQVRVLAGEPDVAGAVEGRGLVVSPPANRQYLGAAQGRSV